MKRNLYSCLAVGTFALFSLVACNDDNLEENVLGLQTETSKNSINPLGEIGINCGGFIDGNWSNDAILRLGLRNPDETNFMNEQMVKITKVLWGGTNVPTLNYVEDLVNPTSTLNAMAYSSGKILYGYALYDDVVNSKYMGMPITTEQANIINATIIAHEYGHLVGFNNNLPSLNEPTSRASELLADAMAGYYLISPDGFNKTNFSEIAVAYDFFLTLGDLGTTTPGHHGTPAQRRAAVRAGFLLGEEFYFDNASEFDQVFFEIYDTILNVSSSKKTLNTGRPEIDTYMNPYMNELIKIMTGEIDAEEFKKL